MKRSLHQCLGIFRRKMIMPLLFTGMIGTLIFGSSSYQLAIAGLDARSGDSNNDKLPAGATNTYSIHLPLLSMDPPWRSPFGIESNRSLIPGDVVYIRTAELNPGWVRLGNRVAWKKLQPNEGDPIDWSQQAKFEDELRGLRLVGATPVVIVKDTPDWALAPTARDANGNPTSCGAIDGQYFDEFAQFMTQVVNRYKESEFEVHDWELGNEPDVDPTLVPRNYDFGCWGDINDPFYGGRHYGEMLKVVSFAIKKADPSARVWIGGLLLASPDSSVSGGPGRPELFLQGILEAGAAPYFDMLAYHFHPTYSNFRWDYDTNFPKWASWGGGVLGKARFMRQMMSQYNVDKPLFLNEAGFGCDPKFVYCNPPTSDFYDMQADYLVRSYTRGLSENVTGYMWYTINGPGWRNSGLLDSNQTPRQVFNAYLTLSSLLNNARYSTLVLNQGSDIEGYEFKRTSERVQVLWTRQNQVIDVYVPVSQYLAAYTRDGAPITPITVGSDYKFQATFTPIYVVLKP